MKDHSMQNPFFRAVTLDGTKVDINTNRIAYFSEAPDGGTLIAFESGMVLYIKESPRTVRGATRKTWPEDDVITASVAEVPSI